MPLTELNDDVLLELYFSSLSAKENQSYLIAKNHLGSTFNVVKTISFIEWKKNFEKQKTLNK